jgi:hypothetical protein
LFVSFWVKHAFSYPRVLQVGLQGLVQAYSLTSLSTKEEAAAVMATLTAW